MDAIGELSPTIVALGEDRWKACISAIRKSTDGESRESETLGKFAMLCGGNQEILDTCSQAIFQSIENPKSSLVSNIRGLSMLIRSPGIKNEIIQQCLNQVDKLNIYKDSNALLPLFTQAAQFWHQDSEKVKLIVNCFQKSFHSNGKQVAVELHVLAEKPGITPWIKEACYTILLESFNHHWMSHRYLQEWMQNYLENNSVSQDVVITYLKLCISTLSSEKTDESNYACIGFVNICLFYENHPHHITKDVLRLLSEGKDIFEQHNNL